MADHVGARYVPALDDLGQQGQQRLHLAVGKRDIAELVPGVDQLDPDAGRIDVADPAPEPAPRMPRAAIFAHQAVDGAVFLDCVMRRYFRCRVAQPLQRRRAGLTNLSTILPNLSWCARAQSIHSYGRYCLSPSLAPAR